MQYSSIIDFLLVMFYSCFRHCIGAHTAVGRCSGSGALRSTVCKGQICQSTSHHEVPFLLSLLTESGIQSDA